MWHIIEGSLQRRLPYQAAYSRLIKYKNDSPSSPIDTITIKYYDNGTFKIYCTANNDEDFKRLKEVMLSSDMLKTQYSTVPFINDIELAQTADQAIIANFLQVISSVQPDLSEISNDIMSGIQSIAALLKDERHVIANNQRVDDIGRDRFESLIANSSLIDGTGIHPFELDTIGRVVSYGNKITLRKDKNTQWEVDNFGEKNAVYTKKVFRNFKIYPSRMERDEIEILHKMMAAQKIKNELAKQKLDRLRSPLHSANRVNFNKRLSAGVIQGEYAITSSTANKPILGTYGAGPCLIVAIYDSKTQTSFLTHIDGVTDLNSLTPIINQFNPETSQVHLYGGDLSSEQMCIDVIEMLESLHFTLHNADIVRSSRTSASLAIDARTGKIYSPIRPAQLETKDESLRLQIAGLIFGRRPLRTVYDGRKDPLDMTREISTVSTDSDSAEVEESQFGDEWILALKYFSDAFQLAGWIFTSNYFRGSSEGVENTLEGARETTATTSTLVSNSVFSPVTTTKPQETYCGFKPGFLK